MLRHGSFKQREIILMKISDKIAAMLDQLPGKPGVYIMKDNQGDIIYVGKSRNLKKRVSSYFKLKSRDSKTVRLVLNIETFEIIVTFNEIEALILENNLIKKHKPRYNVRLKDSKTHPYLAITLKEEFPRVIKVRKVYYNDGNKYFGPFPDESGLRFVMDVISRVFKLCTCTSPVDSKRKKNHGCLKYSIGTCLGPCLDKISRKDYHVNVKSLLKFLSGRKIPNLEEMKNRMALLSSEYRFEEAAVLRDTISALEGFFTRQKVEMQKPYNNDFWGIAESKNHIVVSVFFLRGGKLLGNRTIPFERNTDDSTEKIIGNLMCQFYSTNLIPPAIIMNKKPFPFDAILGFLRNKSSKEIRIVQIKKGSRKKLLEMAEENALESMRNIESTTEVKLSAGVIDLEKQLNLPKVPMRIECIDISHNHGEDCVASLVVFSNGEPRKSDYRKYYIRNTTGIDDPASINEVVDRRLKRLIKEKQSFPDLLIVDGGAGQVSAARKALLENNVNIPLFGLAKREEILYSIEKTQIKLPITSPGMRILIRLRDEAHRFANTFQRTSKIKRVVRSSLLSLPGVGIKTLQKIISVFGSLNKISTVSLKEFRERCSLQEKIAELIYNTITPPASDRPDKPVPKVQDGP
ncbi:MAG: excinuclease ABC subunit UvrC [Candidatus Riflebacteria bacterium]|nr:excinuclease ABC subunit UvrC [Candidatus Riflebacteria bacterium]